MGKYNFGIDVGFGDVKVAVTNNESQQRRMFKFPTAIAAADTSIKLEGSESTYRYNGTNYILGAEAVHHPSVIPTRDINFIFDYSPLLVYRAFEMAAARYNLNITDLISSKISVCVGLPLKYYMDQRNRLVESLSTFEVAGLQINLKENIKVLAQGQGVLIDFICCSDLKHRQWYGRKRTMTILDLGYNTVDVLCVDNGRPSAQFSEMLNGDGLCKLIHPIRNELHNRYDYGDQSEQAIKKAIEDRQITDRGECIDLKELIQTKTAEYTELLLRKINSIVGDFLRRSEKLILAGGGAYYIKDAIREKYQPSFLYFAPNAEFSNARGYLEHLRLG